MPASSPEQARPEEKRRRSVPQHPRGRGLLRVLGSLIFLAIGAWLVRAILYPDDVLSPSPRPSLAQKQTPKAKSAFPPVSTAHLPLALGSEAGPRVVTLSQENRTALSLRASAMLAKVRARELPPQEVVASLGLSSGSRVVDLGAGAGFFTLALAEAVGPQGEVWATDISQEMLALVARRAQVRGLHNVHLKRVRAQGVDPFYGRDRFDLILLSSVSEFLFNFSSFMRDLRPSLRSGGRLVLIRPLSGERYSAQDIERALRWSTLRALSPAHPLRLRLPAPLRSLGSQAETPAGREQLARALNAALSDRTLPAETARWESRHGGPSGANVGLEGERLTAWLRLHAWPLFLSASPASSSEFDQEAARALNTASISRFFDSSRRVHAPAFDGAVYLRDRSIDRRMRAAGYRRLRMSRRWGRYSLQVFESASAGTPPLRKGSSRSSQKKPSASLQPLSSLSKGTSDKGLAGLSAPQIAASLGLERGARVAVLGGGRRGGALAVQIAAAVGPSGRVWALEVVRRRLAELRARRSLAPWLTVLPPESVTGAWPVEASPELVFVSRGFIEALPSLPDLLRGLRQRARSSGACRLLIARSPRGGSYRRVDFQRGPLLSRLRGLSPKHPILQHLGHRLRAYLAAPEEREVRDALVDLFVEAFQRMVDDRVLWREVSDFYDAQTQTAWELMAHLGVEDRHMLRWLIPVLDAAGTFERPTSQLSSMELAGLRALNRLVLRAPLREGVDDTRVHERVSLPLTDAALVQVAQAAGWRWVPPESVQAAGLFIDLRPDLRGERRGR